MEVVRKLRISSTEGRGQGKGTVTPSIELLIKRMCSEYICFIHLYSC
jgi:hypothetical protein